MKTVMVEFGNAYKFHRKEIAVKVEDEQARWREQIK